MDLNLDLLSHDDEIITVALSHYYEQNGDLIPDMVIRIDTKNDTVEAFTFQDTYTYREVFVAMGHRDSLYRLREWIELDDALVGGKRSGKRGRGAEGKTPVLVACETRGERAGFLAMEVLESVSKAQWPLLLRVV